MSDGDTLPRLLARNTTNWPNKPAWRHKRLGIWRTLSWSGFAQHVNDIALGLIEFGFGRGDRLAVLGDNRPDLYAALLAAQTLGGVGVPLDPDAAAGRLPEILDDARVSIVIADTVNQAEQLRGLGAALRSPVQVFCADNGSFHRHDAWEKYSLEALVAKGHERGGHEPGRLTDAMAQGAAHDIALLLYPADAEAASHPLALSHVQLLTAAESIAAADPVRPADSTLSYLPMASYEDAVYSLALGLRGGFACNCPEAPDSVLRDLREIGPTILFLPPAACTAMAQLIAVKAEAATGFRRRCFNFFYALALRAEASREQGGPRGVLWHIGNVIVYAPVRDQLGLNRARWVHGSAPLPVDTERLLSAFGVPLRPAACHAFEPQPAVETLHA